ncbi:MAG: dethiobiotin synthase [Muribaculaceae bacterium]|nr:dethiobiotin synthase [Muribaculaceae bacterium]
MKNINFPPTLFITGIGTDVGKSIATGWLAREMKDGGMNVITQKMIQTGNIEWSEDIDRHRGIMGCGKLPEDISRLTAPLIFTYPASPHLAARIDNREIDLTSIISAAETLNSRYDYLLMEGAGGLMVPIKEDYLTIDFISDQNLPVALVVNGELGSINHALLSLSAIRAYNLQLFAIIYNPYFDKDATICADTRAYLRNYLSLHFPDSLFLEMPVLTL